MASNAKIGLLLGLAVIFVIAFVINGLSGFGNAGDGDDPSTIVVIDPTGIKPDIPPEVFPPRRVPVRHPEKTTAPDDKQPETTSPDGAGNHTEPVKQAWPKVYVVCKGDNLADIAKKFYGSKEGNRRANVKMIFEANNKSLKSPDKIYPGQKIIIPSLWASASGKNSIEGIFPESMFERVESIGRRHL